MLKQQFKKYASEFGGITDKLSYPCICTKIVIYGNETTITYPSHL